MPGQTSLAATIAYVRFPTRAEHRGRLCDGTSCPYCAGAHTQKWGRFAGRQRYRCNACHRTFSTFTLTPLRYLKRPELWRAFLWCMDGRLTVRRSGAVVGIDKNTALRWRHRLLDQWRIEPHRRLRGRVAVGEFWIPLNEKGRRGLAHPRRHGPTPGRVKERAERVSLIALIETGGDGATDQWIGFSDARVLGRCDYRNLLSPRLGQVAEIAGDRGKLCELARFARSAGIPYLLGEGAPPHRAVGRLRSDLRRWLSPFRGVATRRLDNYLEWFRRDAALPLPYRPARPTRPPTNPAYTARRGASRAMPRAGEAGAARANGLGPRTRRRREAV
ncbi:MAG TPA: hypothetical protein VF039_10605 [Longimicrobiales bacterium]